ncbi:hypothetical protein F2Q69_00041157 [Brassica cretica]|uniref:Uncharacterized protein n=1 Tax=Brassica cretica TaxID=69181 RepID=A0A8S9NL62_BRACR|nr:hypothetical protein F2Q69_00041157 [Brassica cretica]
MCCFRGLRPLILDSSNQDCHLDFFCLPGPRFSSGGKHVCSSTCCPTQGYIFSEYPANRKSFEYTGHTSVEICKPADVPAAIA